MEIQTTSPEVYKAGKPATLQWKITYSAMQSELKSTSLNVFLHENGAEIRVGTHRGIDKNFKALTTDDARIYINTTSVIITMNNLKFGDFFKFTVEAVEQQSLSPFEMTGRQKKAIVVSDVKSNIVLKGQSLMFGQGMGMDLLFLA